MFVIEHPNGLNFIYSATDLNVPEGKCETNKLLDYSSRYDMECHQTGRIAGSEIHISVTKALYSDMLH